ncbi:MAG: hypothetical protein AAF577_01875 [Pseudomonadota bacterium]
MPGLAQAQLAGNGTSDAAAATGSIEGRWGGLFLCPTGRGGAAFIDVASVGGRQFGELRVYVEDLFKKAFDVVDEGEGSFLIDERDGWDWRVTLQDDGDLIGTNIGGPSDCRLTLSRELGGFDD